MKTSPLPVYQGRQRTPGHYIILLGGNSSQATMTALYCQGLRGFVKRYAWNSLEPAMGVYDFAELASDVAYCAARGLKLVCMVMDKSFSGPTRMLPAGMEQYEVPNHAGSGTVPGTPSYGGYSSLRWQLPVVAQFNKLTAKIGAQFNALDAFEGISTVETSTSIDPAVAKAHGYTPEIYRDSYINILSTAAANLPNSQVFWTMNWFPGNQAYIGDIANEVRRVGVSMGGPDVLPTQQNLVDAAYPFNSQFKGRMNLFCQVSPPGYAQMHQPPGVTPYWTPQEILDYMRESLFLNYGFWYPIKKPAGSLSYGWADAIPVVAAQPVINP